MFRANVIDIKKFMDCLLKEETFYDFDLFSANISSFINFEIRGEYREKQDKVLASWEEVQAYVFDIIKGRKTPSFIKIVFSLDAEQFANELNQAQSLFLNVIFEDNELYFFTGMSLKEFSLDKRVENIWDEYIKEFFKKNEIYLEV